MKEVDRTSTLGQMNAWKQERLGDKTVTYQKLDNSSLADYCSSMFEKQNPYDYVECMKYINKPLGVQECFFLPEYNFKEKVNMFNYYQKYVCLTFKDTVLDDEVKNCLFAGQYYYPGFDMNIVDANECLKNYENRDGTKMDLKTVGGLTQYK